MKPEQKFHSSGYIALNKARWGHLEKLDIDKMFKGKTVFEPGAGIGDHTEQILKWGAISILISDARKENYRYLEKRFHTNDKIDARIFDFDKTRFAIAKYDICYCYGLLYHLQKPDEAIRIMWELINKNSGLLLLETAVAYEKAKENDINQCEERNDIPSHSPHGHACRPGRRWIFNTLKKHFPFVYMPIIQPANPYYPLDWTMKKWNQRLARAVFIASHQEIKNKWLMGYIPYYQELC